MGKYIKIPLTKRMERDYEECADMWENGTEKDCDGCSLNGGEGGGCLGEYQWCEDNTN